MTADEPYEVVDFALRFITSLKIETDGRYKFFLTANDGAQLWINSKLVVDNDGCHYAQERVGDVFLTQGTHSLTVSLCSGGDQDRARCDIHQSVYVIVDLLS